MNSSLELDEIKGCKFKLNPFILISTINDKLILSGFGFSLLHFGVSFSESFFPFLSFLSSSRVNFSIPFPFTHILRYLINSVLKGLQL